MRACGGAVQGIKDRGYYHNRGNDGFTYFQCGSYSAGPPELPAGDGAGAGIAASLSFASGLRQLVELPGGAELPSNAEGVAAWQLRSPRTAEPESTLDEQELSLALKRELGCAMPGPGLWNNARVQWKSHQLSGDEPPWPLADSPGSCTVLRTEAGGALQAWVSVDGGIWGAWGQEAGGRSIQIGAVDVAAGEVKALLRAYDAQGKLAHVVLSTGELRRSCETN
ncbi:hypothetical protein T484DRAFT_1925226 [Baffinella frigidus]|nr:hypothetical protein T484DRAFT_1925226 [Cryptophyta sp. CCMP2293]